MRCERDGETSAVAQTTRFGPDTSVSTLAQVGYGLVGDLAALAVRLGRQECVGVAAPAVDVGAVHRALFQRRMPGVRKVGCHVMRC